MAGRGEVEMLAAVLDRAAELRNTLTQLTNDQSLGRQWPDLLDQYTVLAAKLHSFNASLHPVLADTTAIPVLKEDIDRVPLLLRTKVLPELEDAERALLPAWENDAAAMAALPDLKEALANADGAAKEAEAGLASIRSANPLLSRARTSENTATAPAGQAALFGALLIGQGLRPEGVSSEDQLKQAMARAAAQSSARAAAAATANTLAGTKRPAPAPLPATAAPAARPKLAKGAAPNVAAPGGAALPGPAPAVAPSSTPLVGSASAPVATTATNNAMVAGALGAAVNAAMAKASPYAAPPTGAARPMIGTQPNVARLPSAPPSSMPPNVPGSVLSRMPTGTPAGLPVNAVAKPPAPTAARPGSYAPPPTMHNAYATPPKPAAPPVAPMNVPHAGAAAATGHPPAGVAAAVPPPRAGPPPGTLAPTMLHSLPPGGL